MSNTKFYLGVQSMLRIIKENDYDFQVRDILTVKVTFHDKVIMDETVLMENLLINEDSPVYRLWPEETIKARVIRYVFHELLLRGYIQMVIPEGVELFAIKKITKNPC